MKEKSLVKNYAFNVIYNLLNILFPIITTSYVSRILFADGVGKVAFANNIVSYFLVIAQLGIPRYGTREVAKKRDNIGELSKCFWDIFSINFLSTIIMIIAYYMMINILTNLKTENILMNVYGLLLIFNLINVDWFYNGIEEYKYITIRSMIVKTISLIGLFIFVRKKEDYIWYGLIQCCAIGFNYIFNIIHLRKFINRPKINNICLKKHLKSIIILFSMTIAVELYSQLDTTMIGIICGNKEVGYYTNSVKMIRMIIIVITSLSTVLLPRLSWYYEKKDLKKIEELVIFALKFVLLISIPACVGIIIVSKPMILVLFGRDFEQSIITIRILAFLIPVMSIGNLFGTQILMVFSKEKNLLISVICGAAINIILNSILITRFKHNGAAIATIISELIVMIIQYVFAKKCVNLKIELKYIISIILGSLMMLVVIGIGDIIKNNFILLIIQIVFSVIAFFIIELICKNEMIDKVIEYIKDKKLTR